MDRHTEVTIRVGWPVDRSLAMLVDMEYQTPSIELHIDIKQLGLSLQRQQIVHVPQHRRDEYMIDPATAVELFDDIEKGFITSMNDGGVFCRYYYPESLGGHLRTTDNSERANFDDVFPYDHTTHGRIIRDWQKHVADSLFGPEPNDGVV